jgi:two-component system chemotaxis response regulator CheY
MKVLLIDDDDAHRLILRHALTKAANAAVFEARNGVEGLRMMESVGPDLILLDLWMPVLNGHGFLERIRSEQKWSEVPVIIMSAMRDKDLVQKLMKLKITDYLLKPITPVQLVERIAKLTAAAPAA